MYQTFSIKEKMKLIFIMLIPILITQLGMFSMVFFNTVMSGKYNSANLAGVAVGSSIWNPIFTGLSGILLAVSPIVAQRYGEKKNSELSTVLIHGIYLSVMITLIVLLFGFFLLNPILDKMNLSKSVQKIAHDYLIGLSFGIFPLFLFNVLRSFIYGLGKTRVVMVILLLSLPINLFFNYVLIFGKWGFPELGGAGAGYAAAFTEWVMVGLTIYVLRGFEPYSFYVSFSKFKQFSVKTLVEILKIGVPMGLSTFFETSMFAVVTIFITKYSVTTIAAYQAAINFISFIYMIPFSMGMALTVLVGFEIGAKRYHDAKVYSWLGVSLAIVIAAFSGILVVIFRYEVAGVYSNEQAVIRLIAHFLIYALFFHISDAIQVTVQSALRGYKDVNIAFIMTLVAYWVICLPVGYLLANFMNQGAIGYWFGLTIGLLAAGVCLSMRLVYIQKNKFVALNVKEVV
jgi:MATE family multidrug resistance protein